MIPDLPTHLLRGFVALAETGSLSGAASRLERSESAISLQMARLEDVTGLALFHRDGRRLALTPQADLLLGHARAILARIDAARAALSDAGHAGSVRLGLVQDFAGDFLREVLAVLARTHPAARVEVVVDRSAALLDALGADRIDVALCGAGAADPHADRSEPMVWFGRADLAALDVLPLAVVAAPCPFLDAARAALDAARRPWRIAFETPSLEGLRAAAAAGIGVACRTRAAAGTLPVLGSAETLPDLPAIRWSIRTRKVDHKPAVESATAILARALRRHQKVVD
jgi:DNA-binding transcriptional LysR family regulator